MTSNKPKTVQDSRKPDPSEERLNRLAIMPDDEWEELHTIVHNYKKTKKPAKKELNIFQKLLLKILSKFKIKNQYNIEDEREENPLM